MEEDIDEKLKEIRKILDDPFHTSIQKDKYLATLKKRLMCSPPSVDAPHIVIFSKENLEREKESIEEEFIIKEREGEIVEGETLFTIEKEETAGLPEFIEIKPEVSEKEIVAGEKEEEEKESAEVKPKEEEEIPEFVEVKPEEEYLIKKSTGRKEVSKESIEIEPEEETSKLPEWKPVEKDILKEEIKVEEEKKVKKPVEKKKKQKKRRKGFSIWEPAEERKVSSKTRKTKDKDLEEKKETNGFEPFFEEEFEEESNLEEKEGKDDVCRYRGYTLYRKEIVLNDGSKRVIHFFSREEPDEGEPSPLPDGYEIKMDKKTGIPFIRKKR